MNNIKEEKATLVKQKEEYASSSTSSKRTSGYYNPTDFYVDHLEKHEDRQRFRQDRKFSTSPDKVEIASFEDSR
jgi:L-lysine 2,3-aminomutase